ncbi:MAG: AMP-binding protein [Fusobacteria bacterium]|nr:AMP-binding protein [Fusobacteriota bacterium]
MFKILTTILNCSNILNREAIVFNDKRYSYEDVEVWTNKYIQFYEEQGVKKGDKVILDMTNTPEFLFTYFAIIYIGAVIVPINPLSTPIEISSYIQDSHAKFFITNSLIWSKLSAYCESVFLKLGVKYNVISEEQIEKVGKIHPQKVTQGLEIEKACTFIYTSGTTGKPKAAMLSLKNLLVNAEQLENTVSVTTNERWISGLPMFHAYGFTVATLLPFKTNATLILIEQFHPKRVIDLLLKEKATVFSGVPMMFIMMASILKEPMKNDLKIGWVGGDSIEGKMFEMCTKMLDIDLCEGYGLSEASPVCMLNITAQKASEPSKARCLEYHKIGSIGPAIYGVEAKIVDDAGREVTTNEVGELIIKGDNVMLG